MTDQPWKPATGNEIGTLGDNTVFMSFAEPAAEHQPENSVDEFLLDICEKLSWWNSVICFHVKVGKAVINLHGTLSAELQRVECDELSEDTQHGVQRVNPVSSGCTLIHSQKTCKSATCSPGRTV